MSDTIEQNLMLISSFLADTQAAKTNFNLSLHLFPYPVLLKYYWETLCYLKVRK